MTRNSLKKSFAKHAPSTLKSHVMRVDCSEVFLRASTFQCTHMKLMLKKSKGGSQHRRKEEKKATTRWRSAQVHLLTTIEMPTQISHDDVMWRGEREREKEKKFLLCWPIYFPFLCCLHLFCGRSAPNKPTNFDDGFGRFDFQHRNFHWFFFSLARSLQQPSNRLPLIDDYQQFFFLSCRFPFYEWTARSSLSWKRFYFFFSYFHSPHFQHSFTSMALMQALICVSFVGKSTNDGGRIFLCCNRKSFSRRKFFSTQIKPKSRSHSRRTHSAYIKLRCCLVTRKIIFSWSSLAFHFFSVRDAAIHHTRIARPFTSKHQTEMKSAKPTKKRKFRF